jgi:hypothetical protein
VVEQLEDISRISLAFYLLSLEDFGDFSQIMYFILILSTREFYLVKKPYKPMIFVIISSSVVGEQGYVILIQTGAELMFCHSFCFSIYQHFVPSFVYHFVYGLVLLCYLNQMQMI